MAVVWNQDIAVGQGIVPFWDTLALINDIDKLKSAILANGKLSLDYRYITGVVIVEYTTVSGLSAKCIGHSCNPNAQTVIKVSPSTREQVLLVVEAMWYQKRRRDWAVYRLQYMNLCEKHLFKWHDNLHPNKMTSTDKPIVTESSLKDLIITSTFTLKVYSRGCSLL